MQRRNFSSGSPWESVVGYSRAVRVGDHLYVAGTTATDNDGNVVGVGDGYAQAKFILTKIASVLKESGFEWKHVVRTRMFVTDISRWEEFGKAHGEFFGAVRPAATMVEVHKLIAPEHLIEIEVDAIFSDE